MNGKSYGPISKILGIPKSTISYIIQKWRQKQINRHVKSEVTITKNHFTTFASEMTVMYEIPWSPLYKNILWCDFLLPNETVIVAHPV
jgi:DNA-binding Lrp family transcriptional regulator